MPSAHGRRRPSWPTVAASTARVCRRGGQQAGHRASTAVAVVDDGVGAGRQVAVAAELGEEGPLGVDRQPARPVLDGGERGDGGVVVGPALDRQRALPDLGDEHVDVEDLGEVVGEPEPLQGDGRDDDGVELGRLRQAGGHVPPEPGEREVGPEVGQLDPPPQRAGGHRRPGAAAPSSDAPDEGVAGVAALGHGGEDEALGACRTGGPWPSARRGRPARRARRPAPPSRTRPCRRAPRSGRRGAGRRWSRRPPARTPPPSSAATCVGLPHGPARPPGRDPQGHDPS